jgi:hypothetical protein
MVGTPPTHNPAQGGEDRYVQTLPLFRNLASGSTYAVASAEFEIWIPSARLLTIVNIGFLPDTAEDATIPAGWDATIDVWAKTENPGMFSGRRFRGNSVVPGPFALPTALPYSYEAVTGVDQWRGRATVPAAGTNLAVDGYLVASVSWEPAVGTNYSPEQLRRIFNACKLVAGAGAGSVVHADLG